MHDVSPELALVDDALAARERVRLPEPDDCLASRPDDGATSLVSLPTLTLLASPERQQAEPAAEPGRTGRELDFEESEKPALPAVDDSEPEAEELESAPPEELSAVPTHMPEWVASDAPPKGRRAMGKDRARTRRERRERSRGRGPRVVVVASWIVLCGFLASPMLAFFPSSSGERPTLAAAPDGVEGVPDAGDNTGHTLRWDPVPGAAGYSVVFETDGVRSDRWSQTADLQLPAGTESEQLVTYKWFVYPAFRDGAGYRYGPLVASGEVTMPTLAPTESS